jgi:hypothetical protein
MKILSREQFGYDVATIGGYVDQVGGELLSKALIGGTTARYVNVRLGIKGTQALNLLNSNAQFEDGTCGWNPNSNSGATTFSQTNITTCPTKYNEALCYKDLYDTYQSMLMAPGQTQESVPFEQQIAELKVKEIQQYIERQLWQATTGSSCFAGFKTLISTGTTGVANSSGSTFTTTGSTTTAGNPIFEVNKLINSLSDDAMSREDLVVFMSYSNFRLYVQALTAANYFQNYIGSTDITGMMEATQPNTNVKIVPTIGLAGSNQVVIGPREYMVVGFDLLSDHEKLVIWYSKDFDELRLRANFNYGATIATFGANPKYFATNNLA